MLRAPTPFKKNPYVIGRRHRGSIHAGIERSTEVNFESRIEQYLVCAVTSAVAHATIDFDSARRRGDKGGGWRICCAICSEFLRLGPRFSYALYGPSHCAGSVRVLTARTFIIANRELPLCTRPQENSSSMSTTHNQKHKLFLHHNNEILLLQNYPIVGSLHLMIY